MGRRKGFIQVVEIIIIVLSAFLILVQLQSLPPSKTDWTPAKLSAFGSDLLASLDAAQVNWFNSSDILRLANNSLPPELLIELSLKGAAKTNVSVACVCSGLETEALRQILLPISLNGRDIFFEVEQIPESGISTVYDVTVVFSQSQTAQISLILLETLKAGKGAVEIVDLTAAQVSDPDGLQQAVFGLGPSTRVPTGSSLVFVEADNASSLFYPLYKYYRFLHTPAVLPDLPPFLVPTEQIAPLPGTRTLLAEPESGAPALIVQQRPDGGRTGWLSDSPPSPARSALIHSLVLWAAGDTQIIIRPPAVLTTPVRTFHTTTINMQMAEPFFVQLSLGSAF